MIIKNGDGHDSHVTSQGQGNLNTVLGALGTASFLGFNGGNILGGMGGFGRNNNCCYTDGHSTPISRYEANMMQELAAKDSKIGLLESQVYVDQKLTDVTAYLMGEIKSLSSEVRANKDAQCAINQQQAVYNGVNTATLQCMQNQIAQLMGITKLVIPNSSVCPGWGNVTITPAAATTTGA